MFVYHGFDDIQMFDDLLVESLLIQESSYRLRTETFCKYVSVQLYNRNLKCFGESNFLEI